MVIAKTVLCGAPGTGKTSLFHLLGTRLPFTGHYVPSQAPDFTSFDYEVNKGEACMVQLWDIPGNINGLAPNMDNLLMTLNAFKGAQVVVLMCDITSISSVNYLSSLIHLIDTINALPQNTIMAPLPHEILEALTALAPLYAPSKPSRGKSSHKSRSQIPATLPPLYTTSSPPPVSTQTPAKPTLILAVNKVEANLRTQQRVLPAHIKAFAAANGIGLVCEISCALQTNIQHLRRHIGSICSSTIYAQLHLRAGHQAWQTRAEELRTRFVELQARHAQLLAAEAEREVAEAERIREAEAQRKREEEERQRPLPPDAEVMRLRLLKHVWGVDAHVEWAYRYVGKPFLRETGSAVRLDVERVPHPDWWACVARGERECTVVRRERRRQQIQAPSSTVSQTSATSAYQPHPLSPSSASPAYPSYSPSTPCPTTPAATVPVRMPGHTHGHSLSSSSHVHASSPDTEADLASASAPLSSATQTPAALAEPQVPDIASPHASPGEISASAYPSLLSSLLSPPHYDTAAGRGFDWATLALLRRLCSTHERDTVRSMASKVRLQRVCEAMARDSHRDGHSGHGDGKAPERGFDSTAYGRVVVDGEGEGDWGGGGWEHRNGSQEGKVGDEEALPTIHIPVYDSMGIRKAMDFFSRNPENPGKKRDSGFPSIYPKFREYGLSPSSDSDFSGEVLFPTHGINLSSFLYSPTQAPSLPTCASMSLPVFALLLRRIGVSAWYTGKAPIRIFLFFQKMASQILSMQRVAGAGVFPSHSLAPGRMPPPSDVVLPPLPLVTAHTASISNPTTSPSTDTSPPASSSSSALFSPTPSPNPSSSFSHTSPTSPSIPPPNSPSPTPTRPETLSALLARDADARTQTVMRLSLMRTAVEAAASAVREQRAQLPLSGTQTQPPLVSARANVYPDLSSSTSTPASATLPPIPAGAAGAATHPVSPLPSDVLVIPVDAVDEVQYLSALGSGRTSPRATRALANETITARGSSSAGIPKPAFSRSEFDPVDVRAAEVHYLQCLSQHARDMGLKLHALEPLPYPIAIFALHALVHGDAAQRAELMWVCLCGGPSPGREDSVTTTALVQEFVSEVAAHGPAGEALLAVAPQPQQVHAEVVDLVRKPARAATANFADAIAKRYSFTLTKMDVESGVSRNPYLTNAWALHRTHLKHVPDCVKSEHMMQCVVSDELMKKALLISQQIAKYRHLFAQHVVEE